MAGQLAGDDPFRAMPSKELPADRKAGTAPFPAQHNTVPGTDPSERHETLHSADPFIF